MRDTFDANDWLQAYGDMLFRHAFSYFHDEEIAANMVQETLLTACCEKTRLKTAVSLKGCLFDILEHKIMDHIRKDCRLKKNTMTPEDMDTSRFFSKNGSTWKIPLKAWFENPESCCDNLTFRLLIKKHFERLPEQQRRVFELRELSGIDSDVICKACNIATIELHQLLHHARLSLLYYMQKKWVGRKTS